MILSLRRVSTLKYVIIISAFSLLLSACEREESLYERCLKLEGMTQEKCEKAVAEDMELTRLFSFSELPPEEMPKETIIEPNAIISGSRSEVLRKVSLIDPAVQLIRTHGWKCDSVSAVQPAPNGRQLIIRCNNYAYIYEMKDIGGNWALEVK